MKEQKWEENPEAAREIIEVPPELNDEPEVVAEADATEPSSNPKTHLTELRRRIEERLDSKRIASEFDWDDFDDLSESYQ